MNWYAAGSWRYGIWSLRIGRFAIQLKAHWYSPLFTERNHIKMIIIPLGFGWRINLRT